MKRLVSVLIIIVMLISLCPVAVADDVVEALKKRIEELEEEIATKDAIIAALAKGSNNTEVGVAFVPPGTTGSSQITTKGNLDGNDLPEDLLVPVGDECFVIEACKTKFIEHDTYTQMRMSLKVRNLTEYSPPNVYFLLEVAPIDENGAALEHFQMGCTKIALSGKAEWLEAICNEDGATGLCIFGYRIYGDVEVNASFVTPIQLYSKDYKVTFDRIKSTGA